MPKRHAARHPVAPPLEEVKEKSGRPGRAAADLRGEEAKNSVNGKREEARLRSPNLPSPTAPSHRAVHPAAIVLPSPP